MSSKNVDQKKLREEIGYLHEMLTGQRNFAQTMINSPRYRGIEDYTEMLLETDANRSMAKLLIKVDEWLGLQDTGTYDYQTGIIMKAAAIRLKSSFETTMIGRLQLLRQAMEMVEPYAETPKGFYLYMNIMITLFECEPDKGSNRTKELLDKTNEIFTGFMSTCKEPIWEFFDLFSGKPPTVKDSEENKEFISNNFKYCLYSYYNEVDNETKAFEYAIPSLRYVFGVMNPARTYSCLLGMTSIVKMFLTAQCFKQLDHCLAGLMHHAVKYRRSLPASERRAVSKIQGLIAMYFSNWGCLIATGSLSQMTGNKQDAIDNVRYEEIQELKEPGVEIYAHQFPIEYVKTIDEVEKVIKRVKAWDKRGAQLYRECGEGEWNYAKVEMVENLLRVVQLSQQGERE